MGTVLYCFCLRSTEGNLIYAESQCFGTVTNMEAEAKVVCQALSFCINKGITNVQMQSDSLVLKQMLIKDQKVPWDMVEIIESIQAKMQAIQVEMVHIFREANKLEDYIVNQVFNHDSKLQFHQFGQLPAMAKKILNMNKSQILSLRMRTKVITNTSA